MPVEHGLAGAHFFGHVYFGYYRAVGRLVFVLGEAEAEPFAGKLLALPAFLLRAAPVSWADIIDGLYMSRLRQSDFFNMTANNVDLDHGILQGVQKKTITTSNPSGVPYLVVMPQPLRDLIARRVLMTKPGTKLFRRMNLQKQYNLVRRAAGLQYVTLQDLRRAAATHLLDNGVDPQTVAEGLGHTTLRMLPSYTPRTLKHHREASEKLSPTENF